MGFISISLKIGVKKVWWISFKRSKINYFGYKNI